MFIVEISKKEGTFVLMILRLLKMQKKNYSLRNKLWHQICYSADFMHCNRFDVTYLDAQLGVLGNIPLKFERFSGLGSQAFIMKIRKSKSLLIYRQTDRHI